MPRATAIALPELKLCKKNTCSNVATGYTGYCYSCDLSRGLRNYSASPTPRSNVKHPMGVEIECYNPESLRKVTHVAEYVCSDASLPDGGGEIKLCAPEDKLENIAADTVQRSSIVGNLVNKKCGLHVHMKLEALARWESNNMQTKRRVFEFAKAIEQYMFDISAKSRRGNEYCRMLYDEYCLDNHHSWITCSSRYPTIEVRIHGGTMNPWKVKGWLNAWKQIRPTLDKVALGKDDWQDCIQTVKAGDITDLLDANSIGYKYLKAREQAKGKLENFGFSVDTTKKKTGNVNHFTGDDYPEYNYRIFSILRSTYLYKTDKLYYTNTRINGRNVKLLLNYNAGVVGDFTSGLTPAQTPYTYELVLFDQWYVFSVVNKFRTVSSSLSTQLVPFV